MAYCSLLTGKLHKKTKTKKLAKILASYDSRFYKTLGDPFDKPILEKVCKMILICMSLAIG